MVQTEKVVEPGPRRPSPIGNTRGDDGFTLIEVLVALVILSLAIAMLLRIFSFALARNEERAKQGAALALARRVLTHAEISPHLGVRRGRARNGFSWQLDTTPYRASGVTVGQSSVVQLAVKVRWNVEHTVALKTLAIVGAKR